MYIFSEKWGGHGRSVDGNALLPLLREESLLTKRGEIKGDLRIIRGGSLISKIPDKEEDTGVPWTFSTFDKDRDEERIDPQGWDLAPYRKNPVILWSHDNRIPAIGRARDVAMTEEKLAGLIDFNGKEYDPFGWAIGERVKAGVLRAGSVGFMIRKIEIQEGGDRENVIFREQELLEFSLCNVPANPCALTEWSAPSPAAKRIITPRRFYGGLIGNL